GDPPGRGSGAAGPGLRHPGAGPPGSRADSRDLRGRGRAPVSRALLGPHARAAGPRGRTPARRRLPGAEPRSVHARPARAPCRQRGEVRADRRGAGRALGGGDRAGRCGRALRFHLQLLRGDRRQAPRLAIGIAGVCLHVGRWSRKGWKGAGAYTGRSMSADGVRGLESQLRETAALLAVARVASATTDFDEALRLICRQLARLTGAETVAASVRQSEAGELTPVAAYHVPKAALEGLASGRLTAADQRGFDAVFRSGQIIWSDDLPTDPRFAIDLFRRFPHQSGLIIPLFIDGQVAAAFSLVGWAAARRFQA